MVTDLRATFMTFNIIIPDPRFRSSSNILPRATILDQPGRLVQWPFPQTAVYNWRVPGLWFDSGSKETLEEAGRIFAKLPRPGN